MLVPEMPGPCSGFYAEFDIRICDSFHVNPYHKLLFDIKFYGIVYDGSYSKV
jgi:hypothetical protein